MERVVINISIILNLRTCVDILSNAKKMTKYWFDLFTCSCHIHRCSLTHHIRFLRPSQLLEIHIYKIYILLQCCWIATTRTGTAFLMVYKRFHGDVSLMPSVQMKKASLNTATAVVMKFLSAPVNISAYLTQVFPKSPCKL